MFFSSKKNTHCISSECLSVYLFYFCLSDTIRYTPITRSSIPIIISFLLKHLLGIYPIIYYVFLVKKRTLTVFQVSAFDLLLYLFLVVYRQNIVKKCVFLFFSSLRVYPNLIVECVVLFVVVQNFKCNFILHAKILEFNT